MIKSDMLHRLAFENSGQPNIITDISSGKIVAANWAACKLLGYNKKELLNMNRKDIFDKEEANFKKMVKQRLLEGHARAFITVLKKGGTQVPCELTSGIFLDEKGVKKAITAIVDLRPSIRKQKNIDNKNDKIVASNIALAKSKQKNIDTKKEKLVAENIVLANSRQKQIDSRKEKVVAANILTALTKSDKKIAANDLWIKYIAKTSYDVMWDWNKMNGQIYVGDSIEEVFGYTVKNNLVNFKDFSHCLLPEEKDMVEEKILKSLSSNNKSWEDSFRLKRRDGSIAATRSRAAIVRDAEGNAIRMIGATQDVSKLLELEKNFKEQVIIKKEHSEIFQLAAKLSYDGIWDWNILTNDFFLGEGFRELFGYDLKKNIGNMGDWSTHLHPDDKEAVEKGLNDAILSAATKWEQAYRFIRGDGSVANVFGRASIIRSADGKAIRMIGAIHDLSRQRELEEKLKLEIELKERQIEDATKYAKDAERADIGKELHDNINQLLSASKLYIEMVKGGGENSEMYLTRSSQYIKEAIEEIRKLTKGLKSDFIKNMGLNESIENLVRDTMEVNRFRISCTSKHFKENSVTDKFKINIFRIIQEQLTNISKYAKATKVVINLSQKKTSIILSISDNGVGFDTRKKPKGIGIGNIISRAKSYSGKADFITQPGKGCILKVTFPITQALLNKS